MFRVRKENTQPKPTFVVDEEVTPKNYITWDDRFERLDDAFRHVAQTLGAPVYVYRWVDLTDINHWLVFQESEINELHGNFEEVLP